VELFMAQFQDLMHISCQKKIRVLGLKSALSQKAKNNNVLIFNIDKISKKTSEIVKTFSKEGIKKSFISFRQR